MTDTREVEMVTLTIDGTEIEVPAGTTILQAAQGIGTEVPHYCYHPGLSSPAMCRLCLVEVEGGPKLLPSCTTEVAASQVVHTQSESALGMRRGAGRLYHASNSSKRLGMAVRSGDFFSDYGNRFAAGGFEESTTFCQSYGLINESLVQHETH